MKNLTQATRCEITTLTTCKQEKKKQDSQFVNFDSLVGVDNHWVGVVFP